MAYLQRCAACGNQGHLHRDHCPAIGSRVEPLHDRALHALVPCGRCGRPTPGATRGRSTSTGAFIHVRICYSCSREVAA